MSEWQIFLSVAVGLCTLLAFIRGWFTSALQWLSRRFQRVPRATIKAVPAEQEGGIGHERDGRVTLGMSWRLTNTSDRPVSILHVELAVKPPLRGYVELEMREDKTDYPLPPHEAVRGEIRFRMPVEQADAHGEAVVADVVFVDQYDNKHRAKRQRFKRRYLRNFD